jgi:glycosyltransferase involved in cell wall biosynthesis
MSETPIFKSLSVIIPTYNRETVLAKVLQGYLAQSTPELIHELLVVDDGSTDGTESLVQEFSRRSPFAIRYLRQHNQGPAAARNLGIREARSQLLLFTDSDVIPSPDLVGQHIAWHQRNPQLSAAVLGYVTWDPEVKATPFMRWYGEEGALFAYRRFRGKRELDFQFLYTCNLSLKTDFLRRYGRFDEDFKQASWEDVELGYRLNKAGLRLLYNPQAVAFHHQFFTFDDACRKALENSDARRLFFEKEAGRNFQAERRRRMGGIKLRFARWFATGVATVMRPSAPLLNSRIPLPSPIYRSLYWYRVNRKWDLAEGGDAKQL